MTWQRCVSVVAALMLAAAGVAHGSVQMDFVTVGNPDNDADTRYDATGYGAVDYVYQIGKYEVMVGQYTTFLNHVAATDPYGLYNNPRTIQRSGSSGSYTYCVLADRANRPVTNVSWGDAARFTNWLHNGQGNGDTETGAYTLNGATNRDKLMGVMRNADAKYWIPTEDEWHKAAYHKNDGVTGNYWWFPTSSDSIDVSMANYRNAMGGTTEVGTYDFPSPYGTFDQGGNVWEWNEAAIESYRIKQGGGWYSSVAPLVAGRYSIPSHPTQEKNDVGFRVASSEVIPEPGSIVVWFGLCVMGLLWWRRRK